jgi:hypothetical protein
MQGWARGDGIVGVCRAAKFRFVEIWLVALLHYSCLDAN